MKITRKRAAYRICIAAMMIALDILLARLLSPPPFFGVEKLSLSFIPNSVCGFVLGPIWGGAALLAGDLLGSVINSYGKPIHPGITATALIRGVIYGLFLYRKNPYLKNVIPAVLLITLGTDLLLQSLWLSQIYGMGYFATLLLKLPFKLAYIPVYTAAIYFICRFIRKSNLLRDDSLS